jgi:hypothetical protein
MVDELSGVCSTYGRERNCLITLLGKLGLRLLGRLAYEMGYGDQWLALVNTVVNLQVS